jgi:hypothetical protein
MLLAGGTTVAGRRLLSADSVQLMINNHTTPHQRMISELFLEGQGWGFGGSVDIATIDSWNVPGRYGWVGGSGHFWTHHTIHRNDRDPACSSGTDPDLTAVDARFLAVRSEHPLAGIDLSPVCRVGGLCLAARCRPAFSE